MPVATMLLCVSPDGATRVIVWSASSVKEGLGWRRSMARCCNRLSRISKERGSCTVSVPCVIQSTARLSIWLLSNTRWAMCEGCGATCIYENTNAAMPSTIKTTNTIIDKFWLVLTGASTGGGGVMTLALRVAIGLVGGTTF